MPQTTQLIQKKIRSLGYYPWTLPKASTERPKEVASLSPLKSSKSQMSTAGFALAFHTLLLLRLRVLILNPTFYHQFRPRRSSRCSPPAWTSRQDGLCLILYTFQFHHSATILGPPICTCCLIQSQETQNPRLGLPPRTRSQRVTTE